MKKSLKYIKFVGRIADLGAYTPGDSLVPFENVVLVDLEGVEMRLKGLIVPTSMVSPLLGGHSNQTVTLYMLRNRQKDQVVAALCAAEMDGVKHFDPIRSAKAAITVARGASFRWQMITNPPVIAVFGVLPGFGLLAAGSSLTIPGLGFALAAGWVYWLGMPLFRGGKIANLREMEETVRAAGFDLNARPVDAAAKY